MCLNNIIQNSDDFAAKKEKLLSCDNVYDSPGKSQARKLYPLDLAVDLFKRTDAILRGLELVLKHHNTSDEVVATLRAQVTHFLGCSTNERVWIKNTKYLLSFPMAVYLKNAPPELPPGGEFKPKGKLRRWFKNRLNAFNRKNTHLWGSWLQVKRCALPVSDSYVGDVYSEHLQALTRQDPCVYNEKSKQTMEKIFENEIFMGVLTDIQSQLTSTLKPDCENDFYRSPTSVSACWEQGRNTHGQCGYLNTLVTGSREDYLERLFPEQYEIVPELVWKNNRLFYEHVSRLRGSGGAGPDIDFYNYVGRFSFPELRSMCYFPILCINRSLRGNYVHSVYRKGGWDAWLSLREITPHEGYPSCEIQAVLEPLKVRVISKGNALEYYRMKNLQQKIHSIMRRMPCFRAIGKKICPTDLYDLMGASENEEWFSVDYSAATDNLSMAFGQSIMEYITRYMPRDVRKEALRILGPHELFYPCKEKERNRKSHGLQTNGQLMGSILSFPILCLANLGVYLLVKESTSKVDLQRVLINGDDMLYSADPTLWPRHLEIAGDVGLEMSVGKAYLNEEFCNINSTCFHYPHKNAISLRDDQLIGSESASELEERELNYGISPYQINTLNTGLIFGRHKVQNKVGGAYLVEGSPEYFKKLRETLVEKLKESMTNRPTEFKEEMFDPDLNHEVPMDFDYYVGMIDRAVREMEYGKMVGYEVNEDGSICNIEYEYLETTPDKIRWLMTDDKTVNSYAQAHRSVNINDPFVPNMNEILRGCLTEESKKTILMLLLENHKEKIKDECTAYAITERGKRTAIFTRNLFLPESLGGMGVEPPLGWRTEIKKIQRQIATHIVLGYEEFSSQRPIQGYEIPDLSDPEVPWWCTPDCRLRPEFIVNRSGTFFGRELFSSCTGFYPYSSHYLV